MDCCNTSNSKKSKPKMDCCNTSNSKKNKPYAVSSHGSGKKKGYLSYLSSVSGVSGAFSSYQVCHSICLGVIAVLSLIGISLTGMPLLFLQKLALPLWTIGLALFGIALLLYTRHKDCMPKNLLIFNSGALITGIPFDSLASFRKYFLVIGFSIIAVSIYLIIKKKMERRK